MDEPRSELGEEPAVFDFEEETDEAVLQLAEADIAAGRFISHEAIVRWPASWRTDNPLPPPKCGD